jgi:transcriptional regulator with XRE-family HTH domain
VERTDRPFVDELPRLAKQRELSLRKIAQAADVNPSQLSRVLRRTDYKTPSAELVRRVAVALDLPPDYFPEFRFATVQEAVRRDGALRDELYDRLRGHVEA